MPLTRRELSVLVPVLLVDEVLPRLKDTELRIIFVVLRQTRVQGSESGRAWLTHQELCRRTGRASEAVSAAVDAMVRHGILQVQDESGTALANAGERRTRTGRRFYKVLQIPAVGEQPGLAAKAKTIEETKNNYSLRKNGLIRPPLVELSSADSKSRIEREKEKIRERLNGLDVHQQDAETMQEKQALSDLP